MKPTDTTDPDYYHKVVDCQWACPAHTDVPGYIRLIAQGRYTEAYLLNRESNVFPGILGRVCDRPCEPACRRRRVEDGPVAICRLKRVASDLAGDVRSLLPAAPATGCGKRVALIGAGCASLTVANDLLPLGYEIVMFERYAKPGGLIRTNIPAFRLPTAVLEDEIGMILERGVDLRLGQRVDSLDALLKSDRFDAVFIATGAPRGKDLAVPGRDGAGNVHIGIAWLESVAFEHTDSIGARVVIIGAGNTAIDCCRTALRLGGRDVKVVARKPRHLLKASAWELDDAEEERVEVVVNHAPSEFVVENGRVVGVRFERLDYTTDASGALQARVLDEVVLPCDDVILAIGQDNAFPFIERDIGIEFDARGMPSVDPRTLQSTRPGVFFGGDAAFGPKNIIWAVEHGHQAAISIHRHCQGLSVDDRPAPGMNLLSTKMGLHEWSYSNDYEAARRNVMRHVALDERFKRLSIEVELGFSAEQTAVEVERCLNCDIQTVFAARLCIECDACLDVCPVRCLTITRDADEPLLRTRLNAPAANPDQALYVSSALPQTARVMVKDEDLCVHCGLCAERCPTGAWDMRKFELLVPYAADSEIEPCRRSRTA